MYSNMKYYENICTCLRVIQLSKNRKLKDDNCWQRTSLTEHDINPAHNKIVKIPTIAGKRTGFSILNLLNIEIIPGISISMSRINIIFSKGGHEKSFVTAGSCLTYLIKVVHHLW